MIIVRCTDDHIVITVSIHVTGTGYRPAKIGTCLASFRLPGGRGRQTRGRTQVHISRSLGSLAISVTTCADDHIVVAITIHIAGTGYRITKIDTCLASFRLPGDRGRQTRGRTQVYISRSLIGSAMIIFVRTDNHIVVAITIHIASAGYRPAKIGLYLVGLRLPGSCGRQTRGRTQVYISRPFISFAMIIPKRPDNHISITITVYITGTGYRNTKNSIVLITFRLPGRSGCQTLSRTQVHKHHTFIGFTMVIKICTDDHIGVAITVHITGTSYRITKMGTGLITLRLPGRGGCQTYAGRTQVHISHAFIGFTMIISIRADNHIGTTITVYITGTGNRTAKIGIVLITFRLPGSRGNQARGRTQVHKRCPFICLIMIVIKRPNNHIGIAVIINIPGTGN